MSTECFSSYFSNRFKPPVRSEVLLKLYHDFIPRSGCDFGQYVIDFMHYWKPVKQHGVSDRQAMVDCIAMMPQKWKGWAQQQSWFFLVLVGANTEPTCDFCLFASTLLRQFITVGSCPRVEFEEHTSYRRLNDLVPVIDFLPGVLPEEAGSTADLPLPWVSQVDEFAAGPSAVPLDYGFLEDITSSYPVHLTQPLTAVDLTELPYPVFLDEPMATVDWAGLAEEMAAPELYWGPEQLAPAEPHQGVAELAAPDQHLPYAEVEWTLGAVFGIELEKEDDPEEFPWWLEPAEGSEKCTTTSPRVRRGPV